MANLRTELHRSMKIELAPDRVITKLGCLAWRFPPIAEYCYLARINRPLTVSEVRVLAECLGSQFTNSIETIYGAFNGAKIYNTQFSIYGMWLEVADPEGQSIQNLPFNLEVLNKLGRPKLAPEDHLVIANSQVGEATLWDAIDTEGIIRSGEYESSSVVQQEWLSHEEWINARVAEAASVFYREFPDTMPEALKPDR